MIEALRQAEAQRQQPPVATPEPAPAAPPAAADEVPAEMPFIEVGGHGKAVSASPEVLAAPRRVPGLPCLKPVSTEPGPLTVAFRPWPAARPTARGPAPELLAFHQPEHPVSKQYQTLLDGLLGDEMNGACRVLLFTGAAPGVGTTTILLNLATCAARGKRRVAAVDLNLQRPALTHRLGLLPAPGLSDVLIGAVALDHALQVTAQPDLLALTATTGPTTPLTAEAVRWLTSCLRERFDVVLVDGPCWEDLAALSALIPACDAVFPVLRENEGDSPAVQRMLQAITRRGGRLRGLLHTQRAA
jgi:Mrp family chromosome partitioning ATPase